MYLLRLVELLPISAKLLLLLSSLGDLENYTVPAGTNFTYSQNLIFLSRVLFGLLKRENNSYSFIVVA